MSLRIDDEKLIKKYKTISTEIKDFYQQFMIKDVWKLKYKHIMFVLIVMV